ncbi:MAG: hypothetical protein HFI19_07385 [Lachnospiraceae bacterium]|jgi:biotin operon repressor|nr:hypothetical protein [Lachnospiraceae bacterium]
MLELIIIIIIIAIVKKVKSDKSFSHHTPPVFRNVQLPKPELSQKEVSRQVNKQIYGTEDTNDRVAVYNRLLLTDRYQDMEKIAHELGISKHQVLREIKKLKDQGHYLQVTIDERNYRLIYPSSVRKSTLTQPAKPARAHTPGLSASKPKPVPSAPAFVKPSKPNHPSLLSGERYEEWMPVPAGKRVVHCSYCGADNLISEKQNPSHCTCYFCREEL